LLFVLIFFFFQAEDGIRDKLVTGVQTCALPIYDHERRKTQVLASLHHFGDPVDGHHLVLQTVRADLHRPAHCKGLSENVFGHGCQNFNPASRAASASAWTRPWYLYPPRSNTTRSMPAALARSAIALPITLAAATLLPPLTCARVVLSSELAATRVRPL